MHSQPQAPYRSDYELKVLVGQVFQTIRPGSCQLSIMWALYKEETKDSNTTPTPKAALQYIAQLVIFAQISCSLFISPA